MPYGRGGAGNILAAAEQKAVNVSSGTTSSVHRHLHIKQDVEAQTPKPQLRPSESTASTTPANVNQDYAHMGRGGAGNWYSPKELSETGKFETSNQQGPVEKEPAETRRTGRGGAGNFVWDDEENEKTRQQKEEMEIELKDMVAKDVEAGLPRPDRVFVRPETE